MSDSDSTSDSDISQGWTIVGPKGSVDSSDHDSDIVILSDNADGGNQTFMECESSELKSSELEVPRQESVIEAEIKCVELGPSTQEADAEPDLGTKHKDHLETESVFDTEDFNREPACDAETSEERSTEFTNTGFTEAQNSEKISEISGIVEQFCVEKDAEICLKSECEGGNLEKKSEPEICQKTEVDDDGECLLSEASNRIPEIAEWKTLLGTAGTSEDRPELTLSHCLPASICLQSGFVTSSFEPNFKSSEGSNLASRGDNSSDGEADDDNEDDDDDEEDGNDDDDESVMRKFHEATLYGAFSRHQAADDRIDNQMNNEEDEVVPPDVDDRCESDISGVADDSDSDLSSLAGIDNLQLNEGDVVRTYRHQPNPKFNSCLTLVAVSAVLFALGIGIGHYIGSTRGSVVHQQQVLRLKTLQDEYFVCLQDTEKLESRLAVALDMSAKEKVAVVMSIWKKKYEELILERAELEYRLNQVQEKVKARQYLEKGNASENDKGNENEQGQNQESGTRGKNQKQEHHQQQEELMEDSKKQEYAVEGNKVELADEDKQEHGERSNSDLTGQEKWKTASSSGHPNFPEEKSQVSSQLENTRCSHQLTELKTVLNRKNVEIDLLRNNANQLVVENSDLKTAIQSQRYEEHPGNSKTGAQKEPASRAQSKKASDVSRKLRQIIRESLHKNVEKGGNEFRDTDLVQNEEPTTQRQSAEKYLAKEHRSEFERTIDESGQKRSNGTLLCSAAISLINLLLPLKEKIAEHDSFHLKPSSPLNSCFKNLENVFSNHSLYDLLLCRNWNQEDFARKVDLSLIPNHLEEVLTSCSHLKDFKNSLNKAQGNFIKLGKHLDAPNPNARNPNETLQHYLTTLRKMVKILSHTLKGVMKSTKTLPEGLASPRRLLKLKNAINNWNHKLMSGWKKIEENLLLHEGKKQHEDFRQSELGQQSGDRGTADILKSVAEKSKQAFEGNRDHKQTESSSSHQKYEEFWKWNHFDPDDFLEEGFFEGNQREWHKYQKRLRKISGRIQRLTEEILLSMDDDDVEDIYDDIEDLADDLEDREIPQQLRTWLTCQTRWWRSRVQRKHRDEDLVKGCGRQLMHWQLRVLCKRGTGKRNRGRQETERPNFCKTVISSQGGEKEGGSSRFDKSLSLESHITREKNSIWNKYYSLEKQTAKKHLSAEEGSTNTFSHQVENIQLNASIMENKTYSDLGAYDLKSWYFLWGHSLSNLAVEPGFDPATSRQQGRFHETMLHDLEKNEAQADKLPHCLGNEKLNKYMQKADNKCRK